MEIVPVKRSYTIELPQENIVQVLAHPLPDKVRLLVDKQEIELRSCLEGIREDLDRVHLLQFETFYHVTPLYTPHSLWEIELTYLEDRVSNTTIPELFYVTKPNEYEYKKDIIDHTLEALGIVSLEPEPPYNFRTEFEIPVSINAKRTIYNTIKVLHGFLLKVYPFGYDQLGKVPCDYINRIETIKTETGNEIEIKPEPETETETETETKIDNGVGSGLIYGSSSSSSFSTGSSSEFERIDYENEFGKEKME